jgi:hypothetical protein
MMNVVILLRFCADTLQLGWEITEPHVFDLLSFFFLCFSPFFLSLDWYLADSW